ncbi:hypothetical protein KEM54_003281 [Ascosphaera aggregata]|nr:hypothetical protein KEM54_003281 [Ascosphaera aggregata]
MLRVGWSTAKHDQYGRLNYMVSRRFLPAMEPGPGHEGAGICLGVFATGAVDGDAIQERPQIASVPGTDLAETYFSIFT